MAKQTLPILLALLGTFVFAAEIQENCEDHPPDFDTGAFLYLEIENCPSRETCFIKKGQNLNITTATFQPKSNSTSVDLRILIGSDLSDPPLQMQIPPQINLCAIPRYCEMLNGSKNIAKDQKQDCKECKISSNGIYSLMDYEFFLPKLMPTVRQEVGLVNLTILLTGDDSVLACALVRASLTD